GGRGCCWGAPPPPFSGASSTVYALALEASAQRSVALIESPRAITLPGAVQEEFFPEIRNNLADALERSLRSDPSLLVSTAADGLPWSGQGAGLADRLLLVVRAEAMSLPDALLRLREAGCPPDAFLGRPAIVLHQRLVRRICPTCRAQAGTAEEHAAALGLPSTEAAAFTLWKGAGCDDCASTPGFRGRVPLAHILIPDEGVVRALGEGS